MWFWLIGTAIFLSIEDWRTCMLTAKNFLLCGLPIFIWHPYFSLWILIFIALGILAEYQKIGIGAADFYLLAWWSGYLAMFDLIKIVMIASFVGILLGMIRFHGERIPFIPCLTIGLVVIRLLEFF
jgi:leader peptidase (prepilin peptidase)/N-methyltransferase